MTELPDGPTPDGRYLVVNGRRWRATDPSIPERLRAELVMELMAARRAVRDAGVDEEVEAAERAARDRVHDAKVALGERGRPWWEEADTEALHDRLAATMRALLTRRGPDSSICPSDAARVAASPDWRSAMDAARSVAADLARAAVLRITRGDGELDPAGDLAGPIRLRQGPAFPNPENM